MKELLQAYWRDANRVWVLNIGDIKPLEQPFGFAMDLAWNVSKFDFDMKEEYLRLYSERELNYHEAERILARWNLLANQTKTLFEQIPEDYKAAYYELVFYPVVSGATYYAVNIG